MYLHSSSGSFDGGTFRQAGRWFSSGGGLRVTVRAMVPRYGSSGVPGNVAFPLAALFGLKVVVAVVCLC